MIRLLEIGLIAAIMFFAQQYIYKKLWNKNLTAHISFKTPVVVQGENGFLTEIIENKKKLPLSMLKVKFQTSRHLIFDTKKGSRTTDQYYRNDVFHIGGGEKITRTISFVAGKRGVYSIENMELVASDLFLTTEMVETIPVNQTIYVYPKPFDSNAFRLALQQLNGEVITKRNLIEDPFEYRGIREYQPYDDIKSINWKASAKTGDLKVNQKNFTSLPTIRIFVNLEDKGVLKKEEAVESCFEIAAGLSKFFLNQSVSVSCYCNGKDMHTQKPVVIESSTGSSQLEKIYRSLCRVDTSKGVVNFVSNFSDILLDPDDTSINCIISPNHYDDMVDLISNLIEQNKNCVWFYPVWEYADPSLPSSVEKHIQILHLRK